MKEINPENLALSIDDEELDKIGHLCKEEYDADLLSRTDFDTRRAGWLKLFAGIREKKTFPWPNASNTHIPLLAYACLQFQARAMEALVPSKNIAKCFTTDGNYEDSAKRAENYLNYQLTNEMEEWEEDMDAALMALPMMGSIYKKTVYDSTLKRNISTMVGVEDFVTNYGFKRLEDAFRKTHILRMSVNDIKKRVADGTWKAQDIPMEATQEGVGEPMPEYRQEVDKINSETKPDPKYHPVRLILEQHRNLDLNYNNETNVFDEKDGIEKPYIVTFDYETEKVLRITSRRYFDHDKQRYETMEHFTHYGLIPNPESHYWYGFGHLVDHINETADTILNQLIDSGTLGNVRGGFILKRSGMSRGKLEFGLGEYKEVDLMTDDIRKAMLPIDFKPPSNVLFTVLGMLQTYVKELTTTADWMAGGLPPSDTAATTMLAVIEQGLKVFSTIQKRCHRSFKRELKKLFILNGMYLDERVYFAVQDSTSREFKTLESGRADFVSLIEVVPASDPNITSRAEMLIKAQQILQGVRTSPLTKDNKDAQYYAELQYYEALGAKNIDKFLPRPEPEQPKDVPPIEENAMFLKEQSSQVLPQQNHYDHYKTHESMLMSPVWSGYITPLGKKITQTHMMEHISYSYAQSAIYEKQMAMQQMMSPMGGANGTVGTGGNQGVAIEQGNLPILEQFEATPEGNAAGANSGGARPYTRIEG